MRKSAALIVLLTLASQARGDVTLPAGGGIAVDEKESYPTTYTPLWNNVVGSGAFLIDQHAYVVFSEFQPNGLVSSLTLSGTLDNLRHISAQGDNTYPTYASLGGSATFNLNVRVSSPSAFTFDAVVAAMTTYGPAAGYGQVGDGIPGYPGGPGPGPGFSITLSDDAVAAANAAYLSGNPFVIEIAGSGSASYPGGFDPSLEGDLSGLQLDGVPSPLQTLPAASRSREALGADPVRGRRIDRLACRAPRSPIPSSPPVTVPGAAGGKTDRRPGRSRRRPSPPAPPARPRSACQVVAQQRPRQATTLGLVPIVQRIVRSVDPLEPAELALFQQLPR